MIFVTTGSMFPFDRLTQAVDLWLAQNGCQDVLMQIGAGKYCPEHARWVRMMRPSEFSAAVSNCDLVVAHVGMGSIISATHAQKPAILLPRKSSLGEVNSDHQIHATEWLGSLPGIWIADDTADLHRLLNAFVQGKVKSPAQRVSPFASTELIENVGNFIRAVHRP